MGDSHQHVTTDNSTFLKSDNFNMLDFFTIFSKGGILLWCFKGIGIEDKDWELFNPAINSFIKTVLLQEKTDKKSVYENGSLALKYKLDNEFELVFVVGYQKMLPLLYLDKLLDEIQLRFRNRFTSDLREKNFFGLGVYDGFTKEFMQTLQGVENKTKLEKEAKLSEGPRSYEQSSKSKKTVNSLIIDKNSNNTNNTNSVDPKAEPKATIATSDEVKESPSEKELDEATRLANLS